jgi:Protein of unknown function (DUF2917)
MNTQQHATPMTLSYQQAPQRLRLAEGQQLIIAVQAGRLWLTEDGRPEDRVLARGEEVRLQGPGSFRLGAFGPEGVQILGMRMRLTIREPEAANSSTSGWKKKPAISILPNHS